METNVIYNEDCLGENGMQRLPDNSVDMILADLPYGTTDCSWDSKIDLKKLWKQYTRLVKDYSAIALTGSEPFSSKLRLSNLDLYKYDWKWKKEQGVNHLNVKYQPLKIFEDIMIFSKGRITNGKRQPIRYNPQGVKKSSKKRTNSVGKNSAYKNSGIDPNKVYEETGKDYPTNELEFSRDSSRLHPTQKPVELFKYLIKTYTNKGGVVLDNVIGSGTTAVACKATSRQYIGFEKNEEYVEIARDRLSSVQKELIR